MSIRNKGRELRNGVEKLESKRIEEQSWKTQEQHEQSQRIEEQNWKTWEQQERRQRIEEFCSQLYGALRATISPAAGMC